MSHSPPPKYSQASSLPSDYGIISSSYSSQRTGHFPRHLYERHQQRPDDNPDDTDALDIDEQLIDNARLGGGLEPDSPSSPRRTALNDRDQFSNSLQVPHRSPRVIPRISPYAYSYTDGSPIAQNYRGSTPPFVPSNLPISPGGTPPPPRRASITIAAGAGGDSNENTPLLRHRSTSTLVPRIQEDSDSESDVGKPKWTSEFWILGKYTLPVFGYVFSSFLALIRSQLMLMYALSEPIFSNILSFLHLLYLLDIFPLSLSPHPP